MSRVESSKNLDPTHNTSPPNIFASRNEDADVNDDCPYLNGFIIIR